MLQKEPVLSAGFFIYGVLQTDGRFFGLTASGTLSFTNGRALRLYVINCLNTYRESARLFVISLKLHLKAHCPAIASD